MQRIYHWDLISGVASLEVSLLYPGVHYGLPMRTCSSAMLEINVQRVLLINLHVSLKFFWVNNQFSRVKTLSLRAMGSLCVAYPSGACPKAANHIDVCSLGTLLCLAGDLPQGVNGFMYFCVWLIQLTLCD